MPSNHGVAAVSQRVVEVPGYGEFRDCLDQQWAPWLYSLGLLAVPVPNRLPSAEEWIRHLQPNAIILTGGNDLALDAYDRSVTDRGKTDASRERDETEAALIRYAIEYRIPVLGCCRGMQFLHAYFGGRLTLLKSPLVTHVGQEHPAAIVDNQFRSLAPDGIISVNSFHNYGIARHTLSGPLVPFAISLPDDTVEGFFHRELPLIGIMWHPERKNPAADFDRALARRLFSTPLSRSSPD